MDDGETRPVEESFNEVGTPFGSALTCGRRDQRKRERDGW